MDHTSEGKERLCYSAGEKQQPNFFKESFLKNVSLLCNQIRSAGAKPILYVPGLGRAVGKSWNPSDLWTVEGSKKKA